MEEAMRQEEGLRNLLKDSDQRMQRWHDDYYATQPYQVCLLSLSLSLSTMPRMSCI
jgi:hypothetical protein